MAIPLTKRQIEDDEAERLALEAMEESLADPRPSVDHAVVRESLLADAKRAARKFALTNAIHAAEVFIDHLDGRYPATEAILFGSRARGDHDAESDVDLAIVFDGGLGHRSSVAADMAGVAFYAMLETGLLIDPLPLRREEFDQPDRFSNPALIGAIQREGVRLESSPRR